jgi:hypothetical protein
MINQRIFSANVGDSSVGNAGPDAIEQDIDNLLANDQELLGVLNYYDTLIDELDVALIEHKAYGVHQKVEATSTDDATSAINAPLKSAGGLAIAKSAYIGNKLVLGNGFNARHIIDFNSIGSFSKDKQLRVRMRIEHSVYNYFKLFLSGGRNDGSYFAESRILAFEASYIIHLYSDLSNLDVVNGDFKPIGNITQDSISWQNVGSNREVDLIIKNTLFSQQAGNGALIIETIGKNNITIIDVQIEDIPE